MFYIKKISIVVNLQYYVTFRLFLSRTYRKLLSSYDFWTSEIQVIFLIGC